MNMSEKKPIAWVAEEESRQKFPILTKNILDWVTANPGYYPSWQIARNAAPRHSTHSVARALQQLAKEGKLVSGRVGTYTYFGAPGQAQPLHSKTVPEMAREAILAYFIANPTVEVTPTQAWSNSPDFSADTARKICYALAKDGKLEVTKKWGKTSLYRLSQGNQKSA